MLKIYIIIYSIFILSGLPEKAIAYQKEPIIFLQRTACFGTCPIYKIEIYSNGEGIYTGKQFVDHIGVLKFNISQLEIKSILIKADSIDFINMENEYSSPISDLPTTFIKIKDKKIKDYSGSPKELKELENLIDKIYQKSKKETQ